MSTATSWVAQGRDDSAVLGWGVDVGVGVGVGVDRDGVVEAVVDGSGAVLPAAGAGGVGVKVVHARIQATIALLASTPWPRAPAVGASGQDTFAQLLVAGGQGRGVRPGGGVGGGARVSCFWSSGRTPGG